MCTFITMDLLVDLSSLSEDVREKLAELDLELSEGKGFSSFFWFCVEYNIPKWGKFRLTLTSCECSKYIAT